MLTDFVTPCFWQKESEVEYNYDILHYNNNTTNEAFILEFLFYSRNTEHYSFSSGSTIVPVILVKENRYEALETQFMVNTVVFFAYF